jgi:hypothetical protein
MQDTLNLPCVLFCVLWNLHWKPLLFLYFISLGRLGHKKIEINTLWLFFFSGILAFKHEIPGSHAFAFYNTKQRITANIKKALKLGFTEGL